MSRDTTDQYSAGSRPRIIIRSSVLALGLMALVVAVAQAAIGLGKATVFRARFTTNRVTAASGLVLRTAGQVAPAGVSEPPAVRQTVILPAGTTLRVSRLPQCKASDAQITAEGAEAACPRAARVGSGGADGVLDGSAVHFDLGIYAVRGHLVFAAERAGMPLKQSFTGIAQGPRLILTVPTLDGRIAPTGFQAQIAAHAGGNPWLVTPARCPHSGRWLAQSRFQGVSSIAPGARPVTPAQRIVDSLPCRT